jgi:hypothetical protein
LRSDHNGAGPTLNGNKITHGEMKLLGDLLGDNDLPAPPDATDYGGTLYCHAFRVSDRQR